MLHLTTKPASAHLAHLNPFNHARLRIQHDQKESIALPQVLNIPLLCDEIATSLTPYTLSLCTQVSRTWHQAFSPVLWANLSFVNQYTVSLFRNSPQIQAAILQHAPHIRSIHSVFCYTFESLPTQPNLFQNLTRLDSLASELHNKGIVDHTNAVRLLQFIKVNTSLREIRLTVFPLANEAVSELLGATLADHPGLVSAAITCFTEAHLRGIRHVLRGAAMGRLECLRLTCRANYSSSSAFSALSTTASSAATTTDQEQEKQQLEALLPEGHIARHFKELRVDAELQHIYHLTILPLLRHCPNLESLLIIGLDTTRSMQGLCQVLNSTTTRLRHLTLACSSSSSSSSSTEDNSCQDEQYTSRLLEACQTDRLQSLVVQNGLIIGRSSIRALLSFSRQHRFTLQELDFENCKGGSVESKDLQLILTSCPNLVTFLAMAPLGRSTGTSTTNGSSTSSNGGGGVGSRNGGADMRINIKDLPTGMGNKPAWVCLRLQRLSIGFSGFLSLQRPNMKISLSNYMANTDDNGVLTVTGVNVNASDSASAVINVNTYVEHIYSQLALLTELKILHLGGEIKPASGTGSSAAATVAGYASAFPTDPSPFPSSFDLTMRSGLGRLETLTRLQELDVQRIWHHRISARECAWMARSLPRLRTFRGSGSVALVNEMEVGAGVGGRGVKKPVFVGEMKKYYPKVEVWIGSQRA
ncbi:hypothetical protein BG015_004975 [Linnemannia schmuckeri]|uniref:F-box domain-containing protein n=1 Tax=Linnemannia schmuckeri TaxID=64567 RepID=A0A9P5S4W9_9FUNG|nr:hypothetical protein BG015_004975 [Linnemannia schmuckeri]